MNWRTARARFGSLARRLSDAVETLTQTSVPVDDLTRLANRYGSDKGDRHFNCHNYTRVYSRLFEPLRYRPIRILEIGLLHPGSDRWEGNPDDHHGSMTAKAAPSLEMWASYFPSATIVGFDVNDFTGVSIDRCQIIRGDMGSQEDLMRLVLETGGSFDIIIDDASHASHHQQVALGCLFPHLSPAGIYVIEDLHWQPEELEVEGIPTTRDVLRRAELTSVFETPWIPADQREYLQKHTASIALYDSLEDDLRSRDALAVLVKRHC